MFRLLCAAGLGTVAFLLGPLTRSIVPEEYAPSLIIVQTVLGIGFGYKYLPVVFYTISVMAGFFIVSIL